MMDINEWLKIVEENMMNKSMVCRAVSCYECPVAMIDCAKSSQAFTDFYNKHSLSKKIEELL